MKLGDKVKWWSAAGGSSANKEGQIIEVVRAFERPLTKIPGGAGPPRDHESYVVRASVSRVGKRQGTLPTRLYWPRVKALHNPQDDVPHRGQS